MKLLLSIIPLVLSLPVDVSKTLTKIAFGSCYGQFNQSNPKIFTSITENDPDLFIWLGDAIYADEMYLPFMTTTLQYDS